MWFLYTKVGTESKIERNESERCPTKQMTQLFIVANSLVQARVRHWLTMAIFWQLECQNVCDLSVGDWRFPITTCKSRRPIETPFSQEYESLKTWIKLMPDWIRDNMQISQSASHKGLSLFLFRHQEPFKACLGIHLELGGGRGLMRCERPPCLFCSNSLYGRENGIECEWNLHNATRDNWPFHLFDFSDPLPRYSRRHLNGGGASQRLRILFWLASRVAIEELPMEETLHDWETL